MRTPDNFAQVAQLLDDTTTSISTGLTQVQWAEDEIAAAQVRWPAHSDRLFHSFTLIRPPVRAGSVMSTESVYRAYARELLDRVGEDHDTRPATAIEGCLVMRHISLQTPLNPTAFGLYLRLWRLAGMPPVTDPDLENHYESIGASQIDSYERDLRRTASSPRRLLDHPSTPTCSGLHHGTPVQCRYA